MVESERERSLAAKKGWRHRRHGRRHHRRHRYGHRHITAHDRAVDRRNLAKARRARRLRA